MGAILSSREPPEFKGDSCNETEINEFWVNNNWTQIQNDIKALLEQLSGYDLIELNWMEVARKILTQLKTYFSHLHPNELSVSCIQNTRNALDYIVNFITVNLSDNRVPIQFEIGLVDDLGEFMHTSPSAHYKVVAVAAYANNSLAQVTVFQETRIPWTMVGEFRQLRAEMDQRSEAWRREGNRLRGEELNRRREESQERKRDESITRSVHESDVGDEVEERKSQSIDEWEQLPERTHRQMSGEEVETFAREGGSRYLTTSGFTYPENWTTTSISYDVLEEEYNNLLNSAQCYDVISLDESKFKEYLDQDPEDNIVLIAPSKTSGLGKSALCYSRSVLKETLRDLTAMLLPCVGSNGGFPADASQRFIRLSLPHMNIFVPEVELSPIASGTMKWTMYQVESSGFTIQATASGDASVHLNFVSSSHCGEGTEKLVYHLRPIVSL